MKCVFKHLLVFLAVLLIFPLGKTLAADDKSMVSRLDYVTYDTAGPAAGEVNNAVADLNIILKNTREDRAFSILEKIVHKCEIISIRASYELMFLQLHEVIKDDFKREYYVRRVQGLKTSAGKIREHEKDIERLVKLVKNSAAGQLIDKVLKASDQLAKDFDLVAIMFEQELKRDPLGEQKIN